MKYSFYTFCFLILTLFIVSCDKEIKLNTPLYESKIVVNGELNTNATVKMEISRSIPILNVTDSTGYLLLDAKAKLYENNVFIGNLNYASGFFTLNYKPVQGKTYRIEVNRNDFSSVYSEVEIPGNIGAHSVYKDSVGLDDAGFPLGQLTVTFKDNANRSDYYEVFIRYYDAPILQWFPLKIESNDQVFVNNKQLDNGAYVFNDATFNGQIKSFNFSIPFGTVNGSPKFEVSIKTFSEDYYRYLQQLRDYNNQGGRLSNPNPIILKTNVNNGLGIVGGVYNAKDTIK